jgi:hypothetical protein
MIFPEMRIQAVVYVTNCNAGPWIFLAVANIIMNFPSSEYLDELSNF